MAFSLTRVTTVKSQQQGVNGSVSDTWTQRSDPRITWLDKISSKTFARIARIVNVVQRHTLDCQVTIIYCSQVSYISTLYAGFKSSSEINRHMNCLEVSDVFVVGLWGLGLGMVLNSSI